MLKKHPVRHSQLGRVIFFMENKSWYAVITADVLYDKNLTDRQKLLFAVIGNMSNERGYCFATNAFFAEMFSVTTRSIQNDIEALETAGYIGRVVNLKPNGDVDYRALTPCNILRTPVKDSSSPHEKYFTPPMKNSSYIITKNNNKENNKKNNNMPDSVFEEFWKAYDKKVNKADSYRLWKKIDPKLYHTIITRAAQYRKTFTDQTYQKHPDKWLRGQCWENEIAVPKNTYIDPIKTNNSQTNWG